LGGAFEIGATANMNSSHAATTVTVNTATTADLFMGRDTTIGNTAGTAIIKAGSMLKSGSTVQITTATGSSTWTGPTIIYSGGILEQNDNFTTMSIVLDGDHVLSEDLDNTLLGTSATAVTALDGSYLTTGSISNAVATFSAHTATLAVATMAEDMALEAGSELAAGSKLLAGSILGNSTYVMGGTLDATADTLGTYKRTELKSGSKIETGSIMAEGSTIGGAITINDNPLTLANDMSVTAGSILKEASLLKAGTVMTQDMTLNSVGTLPSTTTEIEVNAGDVLTTDLYVNADTTLSEDMMLAKSSQIVQLSVLAVNTTNAGTVGLSDTETYRLADVSVLDQDNAQRAISIADSALKGLDEVRSSLGSVQNQLASTISNLSVTKTNIQASESTVRDVDFAEESMIFSKMQLLSQTSSYALAQANASAQNVMNLLQ